MIVDTKKFLNMTHFYILVILLEIKIIFDNLINPLF